MKKYICKQNGYIVVHGSACELKIGQVVSKLVYDNYPNFVDEVEIGFDKLPEIKEPVEQKISNPVILNEEPIDDLIDNDLNMFPKEPETTVVNVNEQEIVDDLTEDGIENVVESVTETMEEPVVEPVVEVEKKKPGRKPKF